MHIALSLRRKRDEIAATISMYEACIDAARMDLAALEKAARLFDHEGAGDEPDEQREFEKPRTPEESPAAQREAWESELPPVKGQSRHPVSRAEGFNDQGARLFKPIGVQEPGLTGEIAYPATDLVRDLIPDEFFYLNWP